MSARPRRLPIRIVLMATVVMTAAVVTAVAAILDSRPDTAPGAVEGPLNMWLTPEKVASHGHLSGLGR